jgi:hypothetical protein
MPTTSTRREVMRWLTLAGAATFSPLRGLLADDSSAQPTAEDVFIWGLPLVLFGRYLDIAIKAGIPLNRFVLSPELATPKTRALGAQVDTLYGLGWIDLTQDSQVIAVPDTDGRYYSIQLLDAYQNPFAYIGRRATGTKAGAFALTAPGFAGTIPDGVTQIKAPTSRVLALVRTLVRGDADLPSARAVHGAYTLGALSRYPEARQKSEFRPESLNLIPVIDLSSAGIGFYQDLTRLARDYPPLPADTETFASFSPLGIVAGKEVPVDPALRAPLVAAITPALSRIRAAAQSPEGSWTVNGWRTRLDVGNVVYDPLTRAANNLYGPGTQVAKEALYFSARVGPDGQPLSGARRYRLRFRAGQLPPVEAFWSVGVYTKDLFLYENPIHRYSITDRTTGLRTDTESTLDILIQHERPADGPANWLPAPADEFALVVRTYQPTRAILNRQYQLPALELI